MPRLKYARWERFCRAYVVGATAGNAARSYALANGKNPRLGGTRTAAIKVLKRPSVVQRIAELNDELDLAAEAGRARAVEAHAVTIETLLGEAEAARLLAMAMGMPSGAVRAIELKAKLAGLLIERRGVKIEYTRRTIDELTVELGDNLRRLAELGFEVGQLGALGAEHAADPAPDGTQ